MSELLAGWRRNAPHAFSLALLLLLWSTAWSAFHSGRTTRSWWWYSGNDSCQGFAAQSESMRLGAPIQTVVWPGATLATPYLYLTAFSAKPEPPPLTPELTDSLLQRAVHFHWSQSGIYGLALLGLVYALAVTWGRSALIGFVASGLLATNQWFLWHLFHVRAEVPSLVFALLACWWAVGDRPRSWPIGRPVIFGALCGLAVMSKIQILPALPLCLYLYASASKTSRRAPDLGRQSSAIVMAASLCLLGIVCMIRTPAIASGAYGLGAKPSQFAHVVAACSLVGLATAVWVSRSSTNRIGSMASSAVFMASGAVLSLAGITLPILLHGGLTAALVSVNRIVFGTLTYARYGLQLEAAGGWGLNSSLVDRVTSFVEFQKSSELITGSLVIWVGVLIVGCGFLTILSARLWASRPGTTLDASPGTAWNRSRWSLIAVLYITAVLCDIATTHRTVSNTSFTFYHIFSLTFYLLASAVAVATVSREIPNAIRNSRLALTSRIAVTIIAATWFASSMKASERMRVWMKEEGSAESYLPERGSSTSVIWSVSPEFGARTSATFKPLREFILARDAAQRAASQPKPPAK